MANLIADINEATINAISQSGKTFKYLDFATSLNSKIANRLFPNAQLPCSLVDLEYYSPFIKNGISDPTQFVEKLKNIGFFIDNPGFVKIVDENGTPRVLKFLNVDSDNVALAFDDDKTQITFKNLLKNYKLNPPLQHQA